MGGEGGGRVRLCGEEGAKGGEGFRGGDRECWRGRTRAGQPAVGGGDAVGGEDQLRGREERVRAVGERRRPRVAVAPADGDGVPAVGLDLGRGGRVVREGVIWGWI